jgi:hypothetical protein
MICGTCRHWHEHDAKTKLTAGLTSHAKQMGTCKRYPPEPMLLPTPDGPGIQMFRPSLQREEPACGEYGARLQS